MFPGGAGLVSGQATGAGSLAKLIQDGAFLCFSCLSIARIGYIRQCFFCAIVSLMVTLGYLSGDKYSGPNGGL
jgi:hypothetical protein